MSTLVRTTGVSLGQGSVAVSVGRRNSFKLSNGNTLMLLRDTNTSATGGQGDNTNVPKMYVYEKDGVTGVVTLRATIADPTGNVSMFTGALFSNNDLGIMCRTSDSKALRYCKLTYATYAVSGWETAYTAPGTQIIGYMDIDATDGNAVVCALHTFDTASNDLWMRTIARLPGAATWGALTGQSQTFGSRNTGLEGISIVALGASGNIRRLAVVSGEGKVGTDTGYIFFTFTYDETTNGSVVVSNRGSYYAGFAPTSALPAGSRNVMLYRTGTNEYLAACMQTGSGLQVHNRVCTWDGTTWATVATVTHSATDLTNPTLPSSTYTDGILGVMVFNSGSGQWRVRNKIFKRHATTHQFNMTTNDYFYFDNDERELYSLSSGGNRNFGILGHDALLQYRDTTTNVMSVKLASSSVVTNGGASTIILLRPLNGATQQVATPAIKAFWAYPRTYEHARYKVEYQYARNNTFTVDVKTYLQADSKFAVVQSGSLNQTDDTLPGTLALGGGIWFERARFVSEFGQVGPWSPVESFSVSHPPSLVGKTPDNVSLGYLTGDVNFAWEFNDPFIGDYQSAYELEVLTSDLVTTIIDTGKVVSGDLSAVANIPAGYKTQLLGWRVKGWDSEDTAGSFSDVKFFTLYDVPTIVVNAPASGATVTTGVPVISFTPTVGDGRTIKEYEVFVLQAGSVVWSSGKVAGTFASGALRTEKVAPGLLQDGQSYTLQISVTDSVGITVLSPSQTFTVDWVPPAAPTGVAVSTAFYNADDEGYVSLTWADAARETAAFVRWEVLRRDDLIDPDTLVTLQVGQYKLVHNEHNIGAAYEFKDYYAPSNYKVNYIVRQVVNRDGNEIDSANTDSVSAFPKSDGYWLLAPNTDNTDVDAFKMSIVTGDTYTDEQEEAVFTVIGKGRVVNKGEDLGPAGSLTVQLRNGGGTTARQKKLRLEAIQGTVQAVWLRNPFGDTFPVNVSSIQIARIAGVGAAEFCDVTIPYAQVGE